MIFARVVFELPSGANRVVYESGSCWEDLFANVLIAKPTSASGVYIKKVSEKVYTEGRRGRK